MSRRTQPIGGGVRPAPSRPSNTRPSRYDSDVSTQPSYSSAQRARSSSRYRSEGGADEYSSRGRRSDEGAAPPPPSKGNYSSASTPSRRTRTSNDSISSVSSTGSSIVERMSTRSVASSRTSLEEDAPSPPKPAARGWFSSAASTEAPLPPKPQQEEYDDRQVEAPGSDAGTSLWGRVVAAAGTLTVNVSSAIGYKEDGEETPPGAESRITVAMKQYYLARAQSKDDLPEWLFDPRERNVMGGGNDQAPERPRGGGSRGRRGDDYDDYREEDQASPPARSRITPSVTTSASSSSTRRVIQDPAGGQSKASNRLREMRAARRPVMAAREEMRSPSPPPPPSSMDKYNQQQPRRERVGLPTGPRRV